MLERSFAYGLSHYIEGEAMNLFEQFFRNEYDGGEEDNYLPDDLEDNDIYLPDHLEEATIADMEIGESGWTVPWAAFADPNGRMWINGSYTIHKNSGGTVGMLVVRKKSGYLIDTTKTRHCREYKWYRGTPYYVGGSNPLPVIKFIHI